MSNSGYIGRFAPSPSGPLHLGSLMSATCSYLQAKSKQGKWLVRIEDVDTPRVVKGMADLQLQQLESFGFEWDDRVLYQSTRINYYNHVINHLISEGQIYACECSRKQLKVSAQTSSTGYIYPKTCINKALSLDQHSLRLKTEHYDSCFNDVVYGKQILNIQQLSSDWVIRRADGVIAYHLAVVLDDAQQGITEVVRGVDILPLTAIHIELQKQLELTNPTYFHHPLIKQYGKKLSKQNHASAVTSKDIFTVLNLILKALGQKNVTEQQNLNVFWAQAIKQWDSNLISKEDFVLK